MDPQQLHERLRETVVYLEFEDARFLTPFDLEPVEYSALHVLASPAGLRMSELSDRLILDKSKVTRIVDHLAQRGWVRREPDPDDRRAVRVVLTPTGQAYRDEVTVARAATLHDRFTALDATDQATLSALLNTLRDHLADRLHNRTNEEPS